MFEVNRLFLLQKPLQTHAFLTVRVSFELLCITVSESISNKVECVEHNKNNFNVFLVMHLFIMLKLLKNHENTQNDAILLFKLGQTLIQTINRRRLLFKEII